jgi:neutral ceramidase
MPGSRASQGQLLAGSAQLSITPPLGVSMAGYYHDRRADDVLDDLFAKALVLSLGTTTVAIVVCDLIGLEREIAARARTLIEQRTQIPSSHVVISCTHTHTGPVTVNRITLHLEPDGAYLDVLARKIADVVQLAFQRRVAASIEVGRGHVTGTAFNRRYWMQDGTLRTNPPFQSPEIDRPAGPIDPELGILLMRDAHGVPLALISNYALHADEVGGTAFCADYQGVESRLLVRVLGEKCVILCPNGCCGDINHFDMSRPGSEQHGTAAAERSGTVLAGEIIKQLAHLQALAPTALHAGSQILQAPLRLPSPEDVAWAEQAAGGALHGFDSHGLDVVRANRILAIHAQEHSHIPIEVSAIVLGSVAFVGLPGEMFVELGLSIKERSPFAHTLIAELCNDSIGYVPTRAAYSEGGYESTSSRLEPGTGETIVAVALELLARLSRGS